MLQWKSFSSLDRFTKEASTAKELSLACIGGTSQEARQCPCRRDPVIRIKTKSK